MSDSDEDIFLTQSNYTCRSADYDSDSDDICGINVSTRNNIYCPVTEEISASEPETAAVIDEPSLDIDAELELERTVEEETETFDASLHLGVSEDEVRLALSKAIDVTDMLDLGGPTIVSARKRQHHGK